MSRTSRFCTSRSRSSNWWKVSTKRQPIGPRIEVTEPLRSMKRLGTKSIPNKSAVLQFGNGLAQLGLRVHDDRAVPGDRFLDRLARYQQEADAFFAGLHRDLVAGIEQHERAVANRLAQQNFLAVDLLLAQHAKRLGRIRELAVTFEHISEGVTLDFHPQRLALSCRHEDVEITRIGGDAFDGALFAPEIAAHDAHTRAVIIDDLGDRGRC